MLISIASRPFAVLHRYLSDMDSSLIIILTTYVYWETVLETDTLS